VSCVEEPLPARPAGRRQPSPSDVTDPLRDGSSSFEREVLPEGGCEEEDAVRAWLAHVEAGRIEA